MTTKQLEGSATLQGIGSVPFRIMEIQDIKFPVRISQPDDVLEAVKDFRRADRECFIILFLNSKNVIIDREVISVGTVDCAAVYPREVLRSAILKNAGAVILAHNHPSGDCTPSGADKQITRDLIAGLMLAQITVHDHVIFSSNESYSFTEKGEMPLMTAAVTNALHNLGLLTG